MKLAGKTRHRHRRGGPETNDGQRGRWRSEPGVGPGGLNRARRGPGRGLREPQEAPQHADARTGADARRSPSLMVAMRRMSGCPEYVLDRPANCALPSSRRSLLHESMLPNGNGRAEGPVRIRSLSSDPPLEPDSQGSNATHTAIPFPLLLLPDHRPDNRGHQTHAHHGPRCNRRTRPSLLRSRRRINPERKPQHHPAARKQASPCRDSRNPCVVTRCVRPRWFGRSWLDHGRRRLGSQLGLGDLLLGFEDWWQQYTKPAIQLVEQFGRGAGAIKRLDAVRRRGIGRQRKLHFVRSPALRGPADSDEQQPGESVMVMPRSAARALTRSETIWRTSASPSSPRAEMTRTVRVLSACSSAGDWADSGLSWIVDSGGLRTRAVVSSAEIICAGAACGWRGGSKGC